MYFVRGFGYQTNGKKVHERAYYDRADVAKRLKLLGRNGMYPYRVRYYTGGDYMELVVEEHPDRAPKGITVTHESCTDFYRMTKSMGRPSAW